MNRKTITVFQHLARLIRFPITTKRPDPTMIARIIQNSNLNKYVVTLRNMTK